MSEKKKIVLQYEEELDKDGLNAISKKIKENLNKSNSLSKQEKEVLSNAMQAIEKEEISFYNEKTINSEEEKSALIKDVLENNIDLIIARDAKTFSRIAKDPTVPRIISEKCSVYTLDNKINTISPEKKLEIKLLNTFNMAYKKNMDERSMMGQRLHINDVKVWNLESLTKNEISNIQNQVDKKLEKCTNRKKAGFYDKLKEEINNNHIDKVNIDEINSKLSQKYTNCIITKNKELIRKSSSIFIKNDESLKENLLSKEFYNKNVIICLIEQEKIKFFTISFIEIYLRNGLEKYDKKIKKRYIYNEI